MNKKIIFLLILPFFTLLSSHNLFSQTEDAGLWTGITFNYDISDKLQFSFKEEIRFHENISKIDKFYSQFGFSYAAGKHLEFGAYYRYENRQRLNSSYSNRHRFHAEFKLEADAGRYTLSSRSRIQTRYTNPYSSEEGTIPSNYFRNKFAISYNVRKSTFTPFVSYELFYETNNPASNDITETWFTLGFKFRLKNRDRVSIFYRSSREINVNNPLKLNIIGVGLTSKLNRKKGI